MRVIFLKHSHHYVPILFITATIFILTACRIKPQNHHLASKALHRLALAYLSRLLSLLPPVLYVWNTPWSFLSPVSSLMHSLLPATYFSPSLPGKIFLTLHAQLMVLFLILKLFLLMIFLARLFAAPFLQFPRWWPWINGCVIRHCPHTPSPEFML